MTATPVLLIAWCALAVGALAAWFAIPRPVELDGERWFKVVLARRLADPDVDVWRARVHRWVPFHPLGRFVERKVSHPSLETMPGAPLEGEGPLLAQLARLPGRAERYAALFDDPPTPLLDGSALSLEHLPRRWLGNGTWEDVADDSLAEEAEQRLHARWVFVHGAPRPGVPDVTSAFSSFATVLDGTVPDWATDWSHAEALAEALRAMIPEDDLRARLMVAGTADGMTTLLAALRHDIPLRDRVLGVLSVGGIVGGLPGEDGLLSEGQRTDWMEAHFRHELLDVEVVHLIPYAAVQFLDRTVDPPGAGGVPVASARFPKAQFVGRESAFLETVDLGVLPAVADLPMDDVAQSLRLVLDLWALSRR